ARIEELWISADGKTTLSGDRNGKLIRWRFERNEVYPMPLEAHAGEAIFHLWVSADGRTAISGDSNKLFRWVFDGDNVRLTSLEGHGNWIYCLWVSADGGIAISAELGD